MDLESILSEYFRKQAADGRTAMAEKVLAPPVEAQAVEVDAEPDDAALAELAAALDGAGPEMAVEDDEDELEA